MESTKDIDFRGVLLLLWKHLNLPSPTPVQNAIAKYLMEGPRRLMVQAFRGVGKSWITAAFVIFCWLRDPQERILVVSANEDRAREFCVFVRKLILEVPWLSHLKPREGQRDSVLSFDVGPATPDQAPSLRAVGIFGQLTGGRASLIIADDIEVPKNSLTPVMRERLAEAIKEFDALLKPKGRIVYLGTPQSEMTVYKRLPSRGYGIRIWPAQFPTEEQRIWYGTNLAPDIAAALDAGVVQPGDPVEPTRFNQQEITERLLSYGRSGYNLQFMLNTTLSDAERYPLKINDLMVMGLDPRGAPVKIMWGSGRDLLAQVPSVGLEGDLWHTPAYTSKDEWKEWDRTIMAIDPSGRGRDETGYAIISRIGGMLFLRKVGGYRDGYSPETLMGLAMAARKYEVHEIFIETNFGGGMFENLLKPVLNRVYPCVINPDGFRAVGQKERRIIDTLEPVMNQHRLVVCESVVQEDLTVEPQYSFFWQMTRITKDKGSLVNDDRVEAVAWAVKAHTDAMDQDQDDALQQHQEQTMMAELVKYMQQVLGSGYEEPSDLWVSAGSRGLARH